MVPELVHRAQRLIPAALAGRLLVTTWTSTTLTPVYMTDGKEGSTNDARCEGTVWESSRSVGGGHGEGDGVAAVGVVKLHVAREVGVVKA